MTPAHSVHPTHQLHLSLAYKLVAADGLLEGSERLAGQRLSELQHAQLVVDVVAHNCSATPPNWNNSLLLEHQRTFAVLTRSLTVERLRELAASSSDSRAQSQVSASLCAGREPLLYQV